jgi:hypothetical protein
MVNYWHKRAYAESSTEPLDLSRRGLVYQASLDRTLGNGASASAQMQTGSVSTVMYLREGTATLDSVAFKLFEVSATSGVSGSAHGQNLNRLVTNSASISQAVFSASVTGASVTNLLAYDVIPGGNKSGGTAICNKVRTLQPDTKYLFEFRNLGNATTLVHATLVFSEGEPDPYSMIEYGINSGGVT